MERYYKRKSLNEQSPNVGEVEDDSRRDCSKKNREDICLEDLPVDPGLRKKIADYHPNIRDQVRMAYLLRGPCQPRDHHFPRRKIGDSCRRFVPDWFDEFKPWLEYSVEKDAAFCLYCYLWRPEVDNTLNGDVFAVEGFSNWKKKERFRSHVGAVNSAHDLARQKCQGLMNRNKHVDVAFFKQSEHTWSEYRTFLSVLIGCTRFLLYKGSTFRGQDEPDNSGNEDILEHIHFLADYNEDIWKIFSDNVLGSLRLKSLDIQKDIIHAFAVETANVITVDVRNHFFSLLVYKTQDVVGKEHMSTVLRFVDLQGRVVERFLGIIHVSETSACTLKMAIDSLLSKYGLSISCIRGQSYDGADGIGDYCGLKDLILLESSSAHSMHCFAHHLQSTLVTVAKKKVQVSSMYGTLLKLINVVESSSKSKEILRADQLQHVVDDILNNALVIDREFNKGSSLHRASDTPWGLHFSSLLRLISMFGAVIDILEIIEAGGPLEQRGQAYSVLNYLLSFEFAFLLHLMKMITGITNALCETLQSKDQDLVNALALAKISKKELLAARDEGWNSLLDEVHSFCQKHDITIPNMNERFVHSCSSRRKGDDITNLQYYRDDLFCSILDMQFLELNSRFDEVTSELLLCMACLNPEDSFAAYDKQNLINLAKFYPKDFSEEEILKLNSELDLYISEMRSDCRFSKLNSITDLAQKMVETHKNTEFPLLNMLLKLCLILPVASPAVERACSAIKIVEGQLCNQTGNAWMNDCLVTYIEKDISQKIQIEKVMEQCQSMRKSYCGCV